MCPEDTKGHQANPDWFNLQNFVKVASVDSCQREVINLYENERVMGEKDLKNPMRKAIRVRLRKKTEQGRIILEERKPRAVFDI